MNFYVTDFLNQQIEEAMRRLGIDIKAEFFRILALNCVKEINVASTHEKKSPMESEESLTQEEKMLLSHLQKGPKTIDNLVEETHLPVQNITSCLVQLLLKKWVFERGNLWEIF